MCVEGGWGGGVGSYGVILTKTFCFGLTVV